MPIFVGTYLPFESDAPYTIDEAIEYSTEKEETTFEGGTLQNDFRSSFFAKPGESSDSDSEDSDSEDSGSEDSHSFEWSSESPEDVIKTMRDLSPMYIIETIENQSNLSDVPTDTCVVCKKTSKKCLLVQKDMMDLLDKNDSLQKRICGQDGTLFLYEKSALKMMFMSKRYHERRETNWIWASKNKVGPIITGSSFKPILIKKKGDHESHESIYGWSIIKMERLIPIKKDDDEKVSSLLMKIASSGGYHADTNVSNVMKRQDGTVLAVDWESFTEFGSKTKGGVTFPKEYDHPYLKMNLHEINIEVEKSKSMIFVLNNLMRINFSMNTTKRPEDINQKRLDGIIKQIISHMEKSFEDEYEIIRKTKEKLLFLKLVHHTDTNYNVKHIGDVARMLRNPGDLDRFLEYEMDNDS